MATTAATLEILVNVRTAQATSSLRRMDQSAKTSSTHLSNLDRRSGLLSRSLTRVGKAALGAGAAYVSLSAAKDAIQNTEDLALATKTLTKNLGFGVKTASQFAAVASTRGADMKTLGMAFSTFSRQVTQANQGTGTAVDLFKRLGVSQKELQKSNPQKLFFETTDALKGLGQGFERTSTMRTLFGRGAQTLAPLLRGGSKALKEQLDVAHQMGAEFSNLGIHGIQDLIDAQRRAKLGVLGLQIAFTQTLQPVLTKAMTAFGDLAKSIHQKGFVTAVSDAITQAADKAGQMAPKVFVAFVNGFQNAGVAGQAVIAGAMVTKLGLGSTLFGKEGSKAGKSFALAFVAAALTFDLGKTLIDAWNGQMLDASSREKFATTLNEMGFNVEGFVGANKVRVATAQGELIFNDQTGKVVAAKGKQLQDLIGKTYDQVFQRQHKGGGPKGSSGPDLKWILDIFNKLPGGVKSALKGIPSILGNAFAPGLRNIKDIIGNVIGAIKGMPGLIKDPLGKVRDFLVSPFRNAVADIRGFINDIINVINTVLGPVGVHIGSVGGGGGGGGGGVQTTHHKGSGKHTNSGGHQQGGMILVPGSGSGDKVPAMLEPGEGILNRNLVAAMGGEPAINMMNAAVPRFSVGGAIKDFAGKTPVGKAVGAVSGAAGGFNLPGVGSLPGWIQPAGSFVLAKVGDYIKKKLSGPFTGQRGGGGTTMWGGTPIASWIAPELKWMQSQGWSGGVNSGYRSFAEQAGLYARYLAGGPLAAAPGTSEHESTAYPGGAVDLSDNVTAERLVPRYPGKMKLKWFGPGDPVHFSGTGHQKGGVIQKLKGGGLVFPANTEGPAWYAKAFNFYKKFAKPGPYKTVLGAQGEAKYEDWMRRVVQPALGTVPIFGKSDYDYRGFWKSGQKWSPGSHFPDTFKTPYDTTFSRESKYATANNPFDWRGNKLVNTKTGRVITISGNQEGGVLKFAGGGTVPNPKHGAHWIKDLGSHVDANEAATLLWQAGLSERDAGILSRVLPAESGGNPRAHNSSGATGLWQILGAVVPGNLYDPRVNALNAAKKYLDAGKSLAPWVGAPSGPYGHILRDRVGAVADKTKTPKTKKKGKKGKSGGSDSNPSIDRADAIGSAYADALALYQDRAASANSLIGDANLEALQRYQTGMAQNPLLGIANPDRPTLQGFMPTDPQGADLLALLQAGAAGAAGYDALHPPPSSQGSGGRGTTYGLVGGDATYGLTGAKSVSRHPNVSHIHIHIDGKEIKGAVKKVTRKESRRGHRSLPSSRQH